MNSHEPWTVRIANVAGIPIRLHFTLILFLLYIGFAGGKSGLMEAGLAAGLFFCVALHELGHALTAQRLGYGVTKIVLYPIGGIATMERAARPRHELWIALAGPAVNVAIFVLMGVAFLFLPPGLAERFANLKVARGGIGITGAGDILTVLWAINLSLALFNLIPAFPMDGGRVLRAALALKIGPERATRIAVGVGQLIAVALGAIGLVNGQFILVLIALFVFFGAGRESATERETTVFENVPVHAAMVRDLVTLAPGDTLADASRVLLSTSQQDFPVVLGDRIEGLLTRKDLLRGLAQDGEGAYVAGVMERELRFSLPEAPLETLLTDENLGRGPILIRDPSDNLVGMVTSDNVMEFVLIRQALAKR